MNEAQHIQELRAAAEAHPEDAERRYALAEALYENGDFEVALVELRECVKLDPNASEPRMWIGQILFAWGQFAEAAENLRVTVRLEPEHGPARFLLGRVLGMIPDRDGVLEQAVELDRMGKTAWAAALRGIVGA
jgi:cytochrome c-type biogenesis protein CcmH/NrfG